jgi:hypothetical protein
MLKWPSRLALPLVLAVFVVGCIAGYTAGRHGHDRYTIVPGRGALVHRLDRRTGEVRMIIGGEVVPSSTDSAGGFEERDGVPLPPPYDPRGFEEVKSPPGRSGAVPAADPFADLEYLREDWLVRSGQKPKAPGATISPER